MIARSTLLRLAAHFDRRALDERIQFADWLRSLGDPFADGLADHISIARPGDPDVRTPDMDQEHV